MDHETAYWLWVIITGAISMGYFVYGLKQRHTVTLIAGLALGIFPFMMDNLLWSFVLGIAFIAAPFVVRV